MFCAYPATIIADRDLEITVVFGNGDSNCAVLGSESQCVIEQISHGAFEQIEVGINLSVAAATDRDVMIVRDRLIKGCDFFDCRSGIKPRARDRFAGCVYAGDKEQIIYDPREPFALGDGGFDGLAILGSRALSRESNLRFAQHIGDGRSQLVREVGGELREARKRIVESRKHLVESHRERLKLARPPSGTDALLQLLRPNPPE